MSKFSLFMKSGLRNKRRNSILMTYGYPDLGSASDPSLQRGSPSMISYDWSSAIQVIQKHCTRPFSLLYIDDWATLNAVHWTFLGWILTSIFHVYLMVNERTAQNCQSGVGNCPVHACNPDNNRWLFAIRWSVVCV